ncbi:MAG: hypothetical protein A2138_08165 [Deltaproteobacteria bacterium RBG_16_71_12]|nr:MAG: hypothetical protein A2138_08165 [Deltaproteobacteria bacterium RBG_16_71_12]
MSEAEVTQTFWVYKRGQLVLIFRADGGAFIPTRGALEPEADPEQLMAPCEFASGQFLSVEWEPRVRLVLRRARDLVELIELLEDRRYEVDLEPPSQKARPFRSL